MIQWFESYGCVLEGCVEPIVAELYVTVVGFLVVLGGVVVEVDRKSV